MASIGANGDLEESANLQQVKMMEVLEIDCSKEAGISLNNADGKYDMLIPEESAKQNKQKLYFYTVLLVVISSFFYGSLGFFVKIAYMLNPKLTCLDISFNRNVLGAIVTLIQLRMLNVGLPQLRK